MKSQEIMNKKVLLIGKSPPPFGGVTIYVQRLSDRLRDKSNFLYHQTNTDSKKLSFVEYVKYIRDNNVGLLHLNGLINGLAALKFYFIMKITGVKIILTYHNDRFRLNYYKFNWINRAITKLFLTNLYAIISAKKDVDYIFMDHSKILNISPYIEPTTVEINIELPQVLKKYREQHEFLITANASKIAFYNNADLYGIDLSVRMMKQLVQNGYQNTGIIYVIPNVVDYEYYSSMLDLIRKYEIEKYFHFYTEPVAYPALINLCDIFIRPTNTDGDAISVREALALKKTTIASDACVRPEGTITFESRDPEDLFRKVKYILDNYDAEKMRVALLSSVDSLPELLALYDSILNRDIT